MISAGAKMASLKDRLRCCDLCPRLCRVDRTAGELGFCAVGAGTVISSAGAHFGEEPPLVGRHGSGTIFFTGCNLGCVFCQNYEISHHREGRTATEAALADLMLRLQAQGCHNINWVTPTHQIAAIASALILARSKGLRIPTVYNCGGYERIETLREIEGQVDIYMPDAKFWSPDSAHTYLNAPDYPKIMRDALKEMHRQAGDLVIENGHAIKGLLVRHLVMPGGVVESLAILDFIAREISPNTYVNVMSQYRPTYRAHEFHPIARGITQEEFAAVRRHAEGLGLRLAE
jgi:putative pyruvate formate lyase activating enzyme